MHNFVPSTLWAAIDVLHNLALQEFNALLTQLRVDQSLHGLKRVAQRNRFAA